MVKLRGGDEWANHCVMVFVGANTPHKQHWQTHTCTPKYTRVCVTDGVINDYAEYLLKCLKAFSIVYFDPLCDKRKAYYMRSIISLLSQRKSQKIMCFNASIRTILLKIKVEMYLTAIGRSLMARQTHFLFCFSKKTCQYWRRITYFYADGGSHIFYGFHSLPLIYWVNACKMHVFCIALSYQNV